MFNRLCVYRNKEYILLAMPMYSLDCPEDAPTFRRELSADHAKGEQYQKDQERHPEGDLNDPEEEILHYFPPFRCFSMAESSSRSSSVSPSAFSRDAIMFFADPPKKRFISVFSSLRRYSASVMTGANKGYLQHRRSSMVSV